MQVGVSVEFIRPTPPQLLALIGSPGKSQEKLSILMPQCLFVICCDSLLLLFLHLHPHCLSFLHTSMVVPKVQIIRKTRHTSSGIQLRSPLFPVLSPLSLRLEDSPLLSKLQLTQLENPLNSIPSQCVINGDFLAPLKKALILLF